MLESGSYGLVIKLLLRNDIIPQQMTNLASFGYLAINVLLRTDDFRPELNVQSVVCAAVGLVWSCY